MIEKAKEMEKIPEGWKRVKFGEVIIENKKSPFKVEDADNEGYYPFFTSGDSVLSHSKFLVDGENIFMSTGGTAYVNFYCGKASYSADTYSFKSKINSRLLYYSIYRKLNYITFRFFIGSGLEHLQKPDFKNKFEIIFPKENDEQRKIAEILETVDNAIEKSDRLIEKYKRIKQGLMQDLLTKGIDENGQIRNELTHKFKDSPLGRIPEEWEVKRLGEVGSIIMGQSPPSLLINQEGKGIPFLQGNAEFGVKFPKPIYYIEQPLKVAPPNSILISVRAPVGDLNLNCKYYYCIGRGLACLKPYDESLTFIWHTLSFYISKLNLLSQGSTFEAIGKKELEYFSIPFPPLHEQQRIASILSQIDETIEKETAYKEKLMKLKSGLMEDLLTGKVRVNKLINEESEANELIKYSVNEEIHSSKEI